MAKQLAIMKQVELGTRDIGRPVMSFSTYISECSAALQVLDWEGAYKLIDQAQCSDVRSLEGHPCWVDVADGMIRFIEVAKI